MPRCYATAATFERLRPRLFCCYRSPLLPDSCGDKPASELFSIWHLDAGCAEVLEDGRHHRCTAGETILLGPGRARRQEFSPDTRLLSCRFAICWPDGRPLAVDGLPLIVGDASGLLADLGALAELMHTLPVLRYGPFDRCRLRFDQHIASSHRFLAVVASWLAVLARHGCACDFDRRQDPRLARGLSLLESQTDLAAVDYARLSEALALGRAQIDRLFRRAYGRTPRAILDQRRLEQACTLLAESQDTIAAIATGLGFCDAAHFRRWFRQHRRMGPDDYRRHLS